MEGFVSGIRDALDERKSNPEYELMLVTPREVLNEYNKLPLRSGSEIKKSKIYKPETYEAGYSEGKSVLDRRSLPDGE